MLQIPPKIRAQFDIMLIEKNIPKSAHTDYRKWLRYYLNFCFKYHHEKSKKESLSHFIKKLKDKNQTEQQQKQAFHAVSIFYGIKNTDQDEIEALKNKKENKKKLV